MSEFVTLRQLHTQCRIDIDDTAEDELLMQYASAAVDIVLSRTGQTAEELLDTYGRIPAVFTTAVLLIVGDWYANREAGRPSSLGDVPAGVDYILSPYFKAS